MIVNLPNAAGNYKAIEDGRNAAKRAKLYPILTQKKKKKRIGGSDITQLFMDGISNTNSLTFPT